MQSTLESFHRDELGGAALLRALVSFQEWVVPVAVGGGEPHPLVVQADSGRWWQIFSSTEQMRASGAAAGHQPDLFVTAPGSWVFGNLPDDIEGVDIDPHLEHAVHFKQQQFQMLRQWSDALRVEALLLGTDDAEGFGLLRRFAGYQLVMRHVEGNAQLVLAPDGQGRKLAAVFTAEDTLAAFLDGPFAELKVAQPQVLTLSGDELFAQLERMPLDGIVFNCSGPVQPKAVAAAFSAAVLRG